MINALRKEVDRRQIEFVKSGKLVPVAFSSRYYDFKRQKWVFGKASDEVIATFIERKVYWAAKIESDEKRGMDWGSDGRAVFGDHAGAFDGGCGAAGSGRWAGADGQRAGGGDCGVDGAGGEI